MIFEPFWALRPDYPLGLDLLRAAYLRNDDDEDVFAALFLGGEAPIEQRKPYDVVEGVAIIPIQGVLFHGDADSWWFGGMSYGTIDHLMTMALGDPEVCAIALHCDSPGGEVAGCFDLADRIYGMRGDKPIVAILDEGAYSAAYAIASAADYVTVPRTGGTGSIGVIAMHLDVTAALEKAGYKVSLISYGDRKTELYPHVALSAAARKRLQADVDQMGEMFVDIVARNRGVSASAIRDTEAGVFLGADGVDAGLVDEVMSRDEAFSALVASL